MHEQSSSYQVREMDAHDRHALSQRLEGLSHPKLTQELRRIRESL